MTNILFVCHGNICRSPLAQSVFAHLVKQAGLEREFFIDSAATSREEIGSPPHPGTAGKLREMGVPLIPHRARQITKGDYDRFDLILVMDDWNLRNIRRIIPNDPAGKIQKLLSFAGSADDIADPWYTGNFDATWRDVLAGCTGLLNRVKSTM